MTEELKKISQEELRTILDLHEKSVKKEADRVQADLYCTENFKDAIGAEWSAETDDVEEEEEYDYQAKERKDEHDYRAREIVNLPLNKAILKTDYANQMRRAFQEMAYKGFFGNEDVNRAVLLDAIGVKKWPEKTAKNVFNQIAPDVAYDAIRKVPLADEIMADIKKGLEKGAIR